MPELPEVETLRRTLWSHIAGAEIRNAVFVRRDFTRLADDIRSLRQATDLLSGQRLAEILRHGKHLALVTERGPAVASHLGMSGQILAVSDRKEPDRHVHAIWTLRRRGRDIDLWFRDPRRFGGLWIYPTVEALKAARWGPLGPDALGIETDELGRRLGDTTRPIKAALLDQAVLAGVGNIYADEALFRARIHPLTRARSLRHEQIDHLAIEIRNVLHRAIEAKGSTLRNYTDADGREGTFAKVHQVYARGGSPCVDCGTRLVECRVGGRSTTFCPSCQHVESKRKRMRRLRSV